MQSSWINASSQHKPNAKGFTGVLQDCVAQELLGPSQKHTVIVPNSMLLAVQSVLLIPDCCCDSRTLITTCTSIRHARWARETGWKTDTQEWYHLSSTAGPTSRQTCGWNDQPAWSGPSWGGMHPRSRLYQHINTQLAATQKTRRCTRKRVSLKTKRTQRRQIRISPRDAERAQFESFIHQNLLLLSFAGLHLVTGVYFYSQVFFFLNKADYKLFFLQFSFNPRIAFRY